MKQKKIYFLSYSKLTNKIIEEYCLDSLYSQCLFVEYIDLTNLLRKDHLDNGLSTSIPKIEIRTYFELIRYFKKSERSNAIYFINIPYQLQFFLFHLIITLFNLETWSIMNFANPIYSVRRKLCDKIISHIKRPRRFIKIFSNNLFLYFLSKFNFLKKNSITFCVGLAEFNKNHYTIKKVSFNSIDYEKAEIIKNSSDYIDLLYKDKIVFLDIYLPFHNDLEFSNEKIIKPEEYYKEVNIFFKEIEIKYNKEVIIAAHPTAIYNINPFDDRKIYWGRTAELVSSCFFVLSHWSTSVNYAVIFKKPIIFFYTSEMQKYYKDTFMLNLSSLSDALSQPLSNTSSKLLPVINKIDEKLYNKYIIHYCSFNTNYDKNINIILNQLV